MDKYKTALQDFIVWVGFNNTEDLPFVVETLLASGLTPAEVQDLYEDNITDTINAIYEECEWEGGF